MWLEKQVLWEPADSQHILEACHIAWAEVQQGNLTEEECRRTFSTRKARFVVYNDLRLTIEASIHINTQLHERELYSMVPEDLRKIRETWLLCGRPNPEDRNDDSKRARQ
jgi:hypothetical protein